MYLCIVKETKDWRRLQIITFQSNDLGVSELFRIFASGLLANNNIRMIMKMITSLTSFTIPKL